MPLHRDTLWRRIWHSEEAEEEVTQMGDLFLLDALS